MADADVIGHLVLALVAEFCAWVFRGVPAWLWLVIYVLSAFASSAAWKGKVDLTPARWLVGAICFEVLTVLMYASAREVPGLRSEPWRIFRIPLILVPVLALTCVSGLARAIGRRSRWIANGESGDKVNNTTAG